MKQASKSFGAVMAIAGAGLAVASLSTSPRSHSTDTGKGVKKDPTAIALDTLEQQLQRRFHDRNNLVFGYGRVVRHGARLHNTTLMELIPKNFQILRDDGQPAPIRKISGGHEVEIEPNNWVNATQIKQTMHAENEDEKRAMATLGNIQVAIYTAGAFDVKSGLPTRLKGPAYLRLVTPDAPAGEKLAGLASRGWASQNEADELRETGWTYRVVKVKADDESCVNCHTQQINGAEGIKPYKLNEPIGVFIIGTKRK